MQPIKALIFDFDGTLANTIPLCIEAFRKAVEPYVKRPLSDEEIMSTFGPDEEGSIRKLAPDQYKEATKDFMQHYEALHPMCTSPFDGITGVLDVLKQKKIHLALVTGKGKDTTRLSLDRLGMSHYFDAIETGSPEGSRKGEAIGIILQSLPGIVKNEVIYIGDAPSDIRDSRKAGIAVVAAAWANTADTETLRQHAPDELFTSIDDFREWLLARV